MIACWKFTPIRFAVVKGASHIKTEWINRCQSPGYTMLKLPLPLVSSIYIVKIALKPKELKWSRVNVSIWVGDESIFCEPVYSPLNNLQINRKRLLQISTFQVDKSIGHAIGHFVNRLCLAWLKLEYNFVITISLLGWSRSQESAF